MPKPIKKPTPSKKHKILPILVALLLAAPLLYLAYDVYADYQDKQRFETVRASVEELRGRLQAVATNGEQWTTSASCSQGSVKFQEAAKGCAVGTRVSISVDNERQAAAIIATYRQAFDNSSDLFDVRQGYSATPASFPRNLEEGYSGSTYSEKKQKWVAVGHFVSTALSRLRRTGRL